MRLARAERPGFSGLIVIARSCIAASPDSSFKYVRKVRASSDIIASCSVKAMLFPRISSSIGLLGWKRETTLQPAEPGLESPQPDYYYYYYHDY